MYTNNALADAICQYLLSGNAALARERNDLLKTQKKLEAASSVLERIRALIDSNSNDGDSDVTIQYGDGGMDPDPVQNNDHHAWGDRNGDAPNVFNSDDINSPINLPPRTPNGAPIFGGGRQ